MPVARGEQFALNAPLRSLRERALVNTPGKMLLNRRQLLKGAGASAVLLPSLAISREASRSLNFLVVGDWGRNGADYQRHVAAQMGRLGASIGSRFTISTGDNFYKLGVTSPTARQWDTSFEEIYTAPSLQSAWYPVLGNHDYGGDVAAQIQRTKLSSRWQMRDRWFSVGPSELGRHDVELFFIDTIAWRGSESLPFSVLGSSLSKADGAAQRVWLKAALKNSHAAHKVVFGHYPIYSVGPHGGHGPDRGMLELDDMLREAGVTAYVCGHDHCLYYIERSGMHYVCSGGGSQELHQYRGDPKVSGCVLPGTCTPPPPWPDPIWYDYIDKAGFAAFSISDAGVDFSFVDRDGLTTPYLRLSRSTREAAA